MSSWWPSGRYSPFASYTSRGPPEVTQDDFTYLDSERRPQSHHDHHQESHNNSRSGPSRGDNYGTSYASSTRPSIHPDLDLDPDILILKHKGTTYPLHFPAFSIAESLKVGELRRQAARETKCSDPHRVKLLYKGRSLRDDSKPCREEGLKQNSELMCVVSSDPASATGRSGRDDGNESSSSASETAIANGVEAVAREPRNKRKGHRGTSNKKRRDTNDGTFDNEPRDPTSTYLSPLNGAGGGGGADRSPSRDRPTAPPSPTPSAAAPIKKPTTPAEILQAVSDDFNTNFLPKVHHLLENPPKSEKERDYESKKLSEGILTQVLFKLDGVQTDDEGIKARRKECVKLANFWSGELDKLQKK